MKLRSVAACLVVLGVLIAVAGGQGKENRAKKPVGARKKLRENVPRKANRPQNARPNAVNKKPNGKKVQTAEAQGNGGDCEEIFLPMCKGLVPYTHTKLPNQFNHTTQLEVYKHIEHTWAYMDHSCSNNMRLTICALYLPKCQGKQAGIGPCKTTCLRAKKNCGQQLKEIFALNWQEKFECAPLPNKRCVKPVKDEPCSQEYPSCESNSVITTCANLTFTWGTLPNMFGQCRAKDINIEVSHFDALVATNCHLNLKFFLCGVYSPFCVRAETPFMFPCKEICNEIRQACEPHYRRIYHRLPWPNKLQCHRYPSSEDPDVKCVMPNEGSTFFGG
ncbi:unnamed protein product [Lymnaea stagnalis]|uniref:FZ domain-containing protein n=1 Tax=Lymnaea stagnalis TaxID=6523 RepID=A0AAV2H945_LYMST